jgi:hypothetical protein
MFRQTPASLDPASRDKRTMQDRFNLNDPAYLTPAGGLSEEHSRPLLNAARVVSSDAGLEATNMARQISALIVAPHPRQKSASGWSELASVL